MMLAERILGGGSEKTALHRQLTPPQFHAMQPSVEYKVHSIETLRKYSTFSHCHCALCASIWFKHKPTFAEGPSTLYGASLV